MSLGREATNETEHAEFVGAYEALNEHGTRLLTKLANLYIKLGYAEGLSWGALSTAVDVQNKVIEQLTRERFTLTGELYTLVTQMTKIVEDAPSRSAGCDQRPRAVDMYDKDILVKKAVLHDFMSMDDIDHNSLQVYIAAWSSMPFISKRTV